MHSQKNSQRQKEKDKKHNLLLLGDSDTNDSRFLMTSCGSQKQLIVSQIPNKRTVTVGDIIKAFSDEGKLREFVTERATLI